MLDQQKARTLVKEGPSLPLITHKYLPLKSIDQFLCVLVDIPVILEFFDYLKGLGKSIAPILVDQ